MLDNQIPQWISVLQGLLTPAVAVAVGLVAFLQWRTAHHRVMLDLFDRRIKILEELEKAIYEFQGTDQLDRSRNARNRLQRIHHQSQFLFGPEIPDQIESAAIEMQQMVVLARQMDKGNVGDARRADIQTELVALDLALETKAMKFSSLFVPYLSLTEKRIRTPKEWFVEKNTLRKSFGDKPS